MTSHYIEEKIRKLASIDPEQGRTAWLLYLGAEGEERNQVNELLDILLFQELNKNFDKEVFLDPPDKERCEGSYEAGTVLYPPGKPFCRFGLREEEWPRHVLISGATGWGKTNLALVLAESLHAKGKPFLIFDWKRNYRDLAQLEGFRNLDVFTVAGKARPFRFNPLIPPPNVDPGHWLMKLVDVMNHAYFGGQGTEFLLREAITSIYDECGLFGGFPQKTPSLDDVRVKIHKRFVQGRMQLWKASVIRMLESMVFEHGLGQVMHTTGMTSLDGLLDKNVVLELDALSDSDKIFLVEVIILWIYEYRKHQPEREKFTHCIVIEEAHHVLSKQKEQIQGGETIMESCLRQIREFGESVICIDQEPGKLSDSIKANTNCKITFALGHGKDTKEISEALNLSLEERDYLDLLNVGEAMVSLKGRLKSPLHVRFDKSPIQKGLVSDQDLAR